MSSGQYSIAHALIGDLAKISVATDAEAASLLERRAFDLVIMGPGPSGTGDKQLLRALSESDRPLPPILIFAAEDVSIADWPGKLRALVSARVTKETLRQTVLDELRALEEALATRFKKSA